MNCTLPGPLQERDVALVGKDFASESFAAGQSKGKCTRVGLKIKHFEPVGVDDKINNLIDCRIVIQAGAPLKKARYSFLVGVDTGWQVREKRARAWSGEIEFLLNCST